MEEYAGKWTLVTGAGRRGRIGAKIAEHLARRGSHIYLHYRSNASEAETVKQEVEKAGAQKIEVRLVSGELSNDAEVAALFEMISPDIVIHNAAIFEPVTAAGDATLIKHLKSHRKTLDNNFNANAKAVALVTEASIFKARKGNKRATVVFIGDAFISEGGAYPENLVAYTMSKAYIEPVVRNYAQNYGKEGFRFFAVMNGPIEPPGSAPRESVEKIQKEIPLPVEQLSPWIGGEAVAEAIDNLLQSKGINGATIAVDGGRSWTTSKEH